LRGDGQNGKGKSRNVSDREKTTSRGGGYLKQKEKWWDRGGGRDIRRKKARRRDGAILCLSAKAK